MRRTPALATLAALATLSNFTGRATTQADETGIPIDDTYAALVSLNHHIDRQDPLAWPLKLEVISRDPYAFFRGTADLFYLVCHQRLATLSHSGAPTVRLHGDVHVGNIGTYQSNGPLGSDIGVGLVDWDETVDGPYYLDLLRAGVALRYTAKVNGLRLQNRAIALVHDALVEAYDEAISGDITATSLARTEASLQRLIKDARGKSLKKKLGKHIEFKTLRFRPMRQKRGRVTELTQPVSVAKRRSIVEALHAYAVEHDRQSRDRKFGFADIDAVASQIRDVVRWTKLGSAGSQGLTKYLVLLDVSFGDHESYVILQLKEEPTPAAIRANAVWGNNTDRGAYVANAQRTLMSPPQWLVGRATFGGRSFLVKPKDAWSKELTEGDFRTEDELRSLARIMGAFVGIAHRRHLLQAADPEQSIQSVRAHLSVLSPQFPEHTLNIKSFLDHAYKALRDDPEVDSVRRAARAVINRRAD